MNAPRPAPDLARLLIFDRRGWKRLPFGEFADSVNERAERDRPGHWVHRGLPIDCLRRNFRVVRIS
ncbi:protein of unknown function [Methanoculleus bourgensis]|jgi:hypothetical protein|uniref:Uncharacterized protein n=1 Tax=Methanoculleus bourgensis TaxID=83986 RepID=A0A0X3BKB2_9EURY|nr:protein of unknown function [Methanoculleus bourgensis]